MSTTPYVNNFKLIYSVCGHRVAMYQKCIDEIIAVVVSMGTYSDKTVEVLKDYIIKRNVWMS